MNGSENLRVIQQVFFIAAFCVEGVSFLAKFEWSQGFYLDCLCVDFPDEEITIGSMKTVKHD